ncbi:MAG: tetratricopeptide repeat protein [Acidobacteriaceae bacterium]
MPLQPNQLKLHVPKYLLAVCAIAGLAFPMALAGAQTLDQQQSSSSSSSSSSSGQSTLPDDATAATALPTAPAAIDASGPPVSMETNESLFDVAVALNACGYDRELDVSLPVRAEVRNDLDQIMVESAPARAVRDSLCSYVRSHQLGNPDDDLAQYVSLALYLTPPPALTTNVAEADMPPDSTQVLDFLPLLRKFVETAQLHYLWIKHRPEYDAMTNRMHDPLTRMILETNIYLKQPTSTYDNRHFLVLLEPMLAPGQINARIYGSNYIVVASPQRAKTPDGIETLQLLKIRHMYLHYEIEPLTYARASAMDRMLPLLKTVQDAPLDFTYKSDLPSLLTECLIRAIEARTMDTGFQRPQEPIVVKQRADIDRYNKALADYLRNSEAIRRKRVDDDMRQGYVLTQYFYNQLILFEKGPTSLNETIGEMVYGMDVDSEVHAAEKVDFYAQGSNDVVQHIPRKLHGLDLAELYLMKGNTDGAQTLAQQVLGDHSGDAARANFILARVQSMHGQMQQAEQSFQQTIKLSKDPRTLAWSHIYLGRIYDIQQKRPEALAEYHAAMTVRDSEPDTKAAALNGIKAPFQLPKGVHPPSEDNSSAQAGDGTTPDGAQTSDSKSDTGTSDDGDQQSPSANMPLPPPLPPARPHHK